MTAVVMMIMIVMIMITVGADLVRMGARLPLTGAAAIGVRVAVPGSFSGMRVRFVVHIWADGVILVSLHFLCVPHSAHLARASQTLRATTRTAKIFEFVAQGVAGAMQLNVHRRTGHL
jgi:hypothetical protein